MQTCAVDYIHEYLKYFSNIVLKCLTYTFFISIELKTKYH